jgi:hypothetical protein
LSVEETFGAGRENHAGHAARSAWALVSDVVIAVLRSAAGWARA